MNWYPTGDSDFAWYEEDVTASMVTWTILDNNKALSYIAPWYFDRDRFNLTFKELVYTSIVHTPESARSKNIVKFRIIVKNDKNRHNWWSTDTEVVKCRVHQTNIDRALSMKFHCSFQTR